MRYLTRDPRRFFAGNKWHWKKFCESCTNYRIEIDCILTEKDEPIKTQNTLRKQANQLLSHTETFTANLKNLEINIKPIKVKTKTMIIYREIRKMFKVATVLEPNEFFAFFRFFNSGPHCESAKFYDIEDKGKLVTYTQNVKPEMKVIISTAGHFFMYSLFINGFTIKFISWLFHTSKFSVFWYHIDTLTIFFPLEYYGQIKIKN